MDKQHQPFVCMHVCVCLCECLRVSFILTSVINLYWSSSSYYSYSPHAELNSQCTTGAVHKQSNLFHSAAKNYCCKLYELFSFLPLLHNHIV